MFSIFKNIIEKVNFDIQFNFRGTEWHKIYKRSKRLLEYSKKQEDSNKQEELARCIKEDIMSMVGSVKAIDGLKDKGIISDGEYNELKQYLDK